MAVIVLGAQDLINARVKIEQTIHVILQTKTTPWVQ
jgi:hypothetical protein